MDYPKYIAALAKAYSTPDRPAGYVEEELHNTYLALMRGCMTGKLTLDDMPDLVDTEVSGGTQIGIPGYHRWFESIPAVAVSDSSKPRSLHEQ